jgi:hypothetical protein
MIFFLLGLIIFPFCITMFFQIHGIGGAVLLGLDMIAVDCLWQWLRFQLFKKFGTQQLLYGILGGLILRTITAIFFLKFGAWWLGFQSTAFFIMILFLLFIPLISLIEAKKIKMETKAE